MDFRIMRGREFLVLLARDEAATGCKASASIGDFAAVAVAPELAEGFVFKKE